MSDRNGCSDEHGLNPRDYVPFSTKADFSGAEPVVDMERRHIDARRARLPSDHPFTGLALSGGGIRSATFNLGVLQCMARRGMLDKVDYLSTVSGGGYIGAALTWFLHHRESADGGPRFDTSEDGFPFGTHRRGKLKDQPSSGPGEAEPGGDRDKASALRHLRQNGKYLAPGCGLTVLSLISVLLRGTFLSLLVFLPILIAGFLMLHFAHLIRPIGDYPQVLRWFFEWQAGSGEVYLLNTPLVLAVFFTVVGCATSVVYSWWTYSEGGVTGRYRPRRFFETYAGRLTIIILVLLVLASLPYMARFIDNPPQAGFVSTALGILASVFAFLKSNTSSGKGRDYLPLLVWLAAALLFYGILLSSYLLAIKLTANGSWSVWTASALFAVFALAVGRVTNLNYVSIHRYYRDRLMETYLPNIHDALKGSSDCHVVTLDADKAALSEMCDPRFGNGPYHIINTNLVLVSSDVKKFRGRGGDNFMLSPEYCGSNATGWLPTKWFMNNQMTLATAMAISGAAANPNTGVGGRGPTRNPVLSLLMSLLNLRLGYWAPNPNPDINRWQLPKSQQEPDSKLKRLVSEINPLHGYRPNFFVPTLTATALGSAVGRLVLLVNSMLPEKVRISERSFGKNEKNRFIELTDGGHFENLGLYELVRRRLPCIIVCDAAADKEFGFNDLANAIEKVRVDFGASIRLDVDPLIPRKTSDHGAFESAESAVVRGTICYADNSMGHLYYIKTTFFEGLQADLMAYKMSNPAFPDESTADQFFDEQQFEAYRELGFQSGELLAEVFHCPKRPITDAASSG